jgi:hypothetical protein
MNAIEQNNIQNVQILKFVSYYPLKMCALICKAGCRHLKKQARACGGMLATFPTPPPPALPPKNPLTVFYFTN